VLQPELLDLTIPFLRPTPKKDFDAWPALFSAFSSYLRLHFAQHELKVRLERITRIDTTLRSHRANAIHSNISNMITSWHLSDEVHTVRRPFIVEKV
jgi:hypothetical protein